MDEPESHEVDEYGVPEIDLTRRRQLRAVAQYVQGIHHHIDPDMFDTDEARLRAVLGRLDDDDPDTTRISVTYGDLLFLETLIDAAGTYAERRDSPELDGVDDDELEELLAWISGEANALFRKPPTPH